MATWGCFWSGSTWLSMARTKAAVFPVPDWDWAIRFCGLQTGGHREQGRGGLSAAQRERPPLSECHASRQFEWAASGHGENSPTSSKDPLGDPLHPSRYLFRPPLPSKAAKLARSPSSPPGGQDLRLREHHGQGVLLDLGGPVEAHGIDPLEQLGLPEWGEQR